MVRQGLLGLGLLLLGTIVAQAEDLSGPQPGQRPGPYTAVMSTGAGRGRSYCYMCETGDRPAVIVFARGLSEPLGKLVQQLDRAVAAHEKAELRAWVTILSNDQPALDAKVIQWSQQLALRRTPLG